ncbi:hypothetical protein J5Y42_004657 [Salmonella enterica]|uniref:hypothetical protein n=1 Tax=Klebsiella pneumoniae TaxID=573 RepID=UPI001A904261|nr:hypothetical protein [Klebsiella pneumoniae]EHG7596365.1 hypothetical protein [Salmonella enterica]EHG7632714.1 hypothetical protein [Salmonella enterica]MBN9733252.1 hypothetical protein [Klebsiella pneumoniae]HBY4049866.1 hypothetical protein [Klebsiella pneumoniae]HBY4077722.1 hypothetical protein [Klebsiella pneumoniae]
MKLLRIFAAVFMFAGILAGCLVLLLLRFPPLLIAVLLACWIFCRLVKALAPGTAAAESTGTGQDHSCVMPATKTTP